MQTLDGWKRREKGRKTDKTFVALVADFASIVSIACFSFRISLQLLKHMTLEDAEMCRQLSHVKISSLIFLSFSKVC